MKKIPIFISIILILLVAGGYYFYKYQSNSKTVAWDIIPDNALAIYERDNCTSCIEEISRSPVWQIIERASFYTKPDSFKTAFQKMIRTRQDLLVSMHATKKDDFDFVFYFPLDKNDLGLVSKGFENRKYVSSQREFASRQIHEINFSGHVFSWATIGNIWVGSFTPFLIEDVIRTSNQKKSSIRKNFALSKQLPRIAGDAGNVYLRLDNLALWVSVFSRDTSPFIESFGRSSVLDIKTEGNSIALNGFSTDSSDRSDNILSIFHNQTPVSFSLKHLISDRTLALHSFGVSDGVAFKKDLDSFVKVKGARRKDSIQWLQQKAGTSIDKLYKTLSHEVALCFLESSKQKKFSKILIVETREPDVWLNSFTQLSEKLSIDTIFYESYSTFKIREVPVFRFPEKLFWPLITGFDNCFYTTIGNSIIIGEDLDVLKKFLNDIENENTWGKSVYHNKFLESTLLESNISLYVNAPKIWNLLSQNLHPKWKKFVTDNPVLLRSLQLGAIQFSHLNNGYYTNASITYKVTVADEGTKKQSGRVVTQFNEDIADFYQVKSHVNRSDELLVQDSLNDLYLVSDDGNVLWKIPVGDRITSEVSQIDFYGNGKLQYFFSTRDALHVIDRLGNYVAPYPLHLPSVTISHTSVIDYDHSKNYRFLVGDESGKLWMYDKKGNNLDGWNAKDIGGDLAFAPQHHRIKGKDYIIAIRKDGVIYLMNRRGEDLKNYPIKVEAKVSGDYFLDKGNTLSDTYFIVVSDDGYRIKFTVEGKIESRETLLKTAVNSKFGLVKEKGDNSYLIYQQDSRMFNLIDESGKQFISNEFIGSGVPIVNYSDEGSGKRYVAISDTGQGLTYVYDESGNLIVSPPIRGRAIVLSSANSDDDKVCSFEGKSLTIEKL